MLKVTLSSSLEFESKESLVNDLIEIVENNDLHEDDSYQEYVPENWKDPNSWDDDSIHNFLVNCGALVFGHYHDLEYVFQDWIVESNASIEEVN
jgi:hypothetical protein